MLQDGTEVFFRIKQSAALRKLMQAYCDRQSVDMNMIAFLFDGRRLKPEQTPAEVHPSSTPFPPRRLVAQTGTSTLQLLHLSLFVSLGAGRGFVHYSLSSCHLTERFSCCLLLLVAISHPVSLCQYTLRDFLFTGCMHGRLLFLKM